MTENEDNINFCFIPKTLLSVPLEKESIEQGDIFGFQIQTGNKLYNDVFCLSNTLTERGKERAREIYQY